MSHRTTVLSITLTLVLLVLGCSAFAGVYYVKKDGNDANAGTSWSVPKATVQAAIGSANPGDEVWVAAGVYFECVLIEKGIGIYGGFKGDESSRSQRDWVKNVTTLDGRNLDVVVKVLIGPDVVAVVDGFTIRGGRGGVSCDGRSVIAHNTIVYNTRTNHGGGVDCGGSATIYNNIIAENVARDDAGDWGEGRAIGGGIYCSGSPSIISNTIASNKAYLELGTPSSGYHQFGGYGGGIACDDASSPLIVNNIVSGNWSEFDAISVGAANVAFHNNCVTDTIDRADLLSDLSNIQSSPKFSNSYPLDYHISADSPCIDKGDDSVLASGWVDMDLEKRLRLPHVDIGCDEWTPGPPSSVSINPGGGTMPTNVETTLTTVFSDPAGANNISLCYLLVDATLSWKYCPYVKYDARTNLLYMRNDASTSWGTGATPGSSTVLQNSYCTLYCAGTSVTKAGNRITIDWRMLFKAPMAGRNCSTYLKVINRQNLFDEWRPVGSLNISAAPLSISVTPANWYGTTNTKFRLSSLYYDPAGAGNIIWCYMLINSGLNWINAPYVKYDADKNLLYIRNDASSSWGTGAAPGSSTVLQNSYCSLYCAETTVTKSGNYLTINWAVSLKPTMSRKSCLIYLKVINRQNLFDEWRSFGALTTDCNENDEYSYCWPLDPSSVFAVDLDYGDQSGLHSSYTGMNDLGQLVGYTNRSGRDDAFVWKKGSKTYLPSLAGGNTIACAINNLGQVVGSSVASDGSTHAVIWDSGKIRDLGTLGGASSAAYDINDRGQVVGEAGTYGGLWHACIWNNGIPTDLGTLGGYGSTAYAINNSGTVIGGSDDLIGIWHGFVWRDGQMQITCEPECCHYEFSSHVVDVNDQECVVGYGSDHDASWASLGCGSSYREWGEYDAEYRLDWGVEHVNNAGWTTGYYDGPVVWTASGYELYLDSALANYPNTAVTGYDAINNRYWIVTHASTQTASGSVSRDFLITPPEPPENLSLSPTSGTYTIGTKIGLTARFFDLNGYQDMSYCELLVNTGLSGTNGCYVSYDAVANKLYLRNDAGTAWLGGYSPGSANVIENNCCRLYCAESTVSGSGMERAIKLTIALRTPMAGKTLQTWVMVADNEGRASSWQKMGSLTIRGGPSTISVSPSSGTVTTNSKTTLTTVFSDPAGAGNIQWCYMLVNSAASWKYAPYIKYDAGLNLLYVRNDASTSWGTGAKPGSSTVLQNSYCSLYCGETTVSKSGNKLTIGWKLLFKPTMAGKDCSTYLKVINYQNLFDDWRPLGTLSIRNP